MGIARLIDRDKKQARRRDYRAMVAQWRAASGGERCRPVSARCAPGRADVYDV